MILRGDSVIHIDVIGPPPPSGNRLTASTASAVFQPGITPEKQATKGAAIEIGRRTSKPTSGVGMQSVPTAPPVLPSSALPK